MAGKSTKAAGGRKTVAKKTAGTVKTAGSAKAADRKKAENDRIFAERLGRHHDELRWLYMELYGNDDMFAELCGQMKRYYDLEWYRKRDMVGMMMYIDNFAGNIKGVQEKLPYLESCNVNYIHLMPFLDSPKGRSDGAMTKGSVCAWIS